MKHMAWLMLMPILVGQGEDAVKKDLKAMEGNWVMAALEVNGRDVAVDKLGSSLTIKGSDYVVTIKDKKFAVAISLDPAKDPKEMNMLFQEGANKDKVHKAIYKIEKDTLFICRGLNPEHDRPREFATWPDTGYFVVRWKKN